MKGRAKSAWSIMEGDWHLVKWVGLCVVRVARMCKMDRGGMYIEGLPHFTVTEDEWSEFPPEQILHPPLAAALS